MPQRSKKCVLGSTSRSLSCHCAVCWWRDRTLFMSCSDKDTEMKWKYWLCVIQMQQQGYIHSIRQLPLRSSQLYDGSADYNAGPGSIQRWHQCPQKIIFWCINHPMSELWGLMFVETTGTWNHWNVYSPRFSYLPLYCWWRLHRWWGRRGTRGDDMLEHPFGEGGCCQLEWQCQECDWAARGLIRICL